MRLSKLGQTSQAAFAASSFSSWFYSRFGHTTIPETFMTCDKNMTCDWSVSTRNQFNNPKILTSKPTFMDELIRGMANQELGLRDISFVEDIRNHLFDEPKRNEGGKDLVAISIQVILNQLESFTANI